MSETLSINGTPKTEKESEEAPKDPSKSPKMVIATAMMTAITTILVSFIGIVPQLRRGDTNEINALKQSFNELKQEKTVSPLPSISADKKIDVSGTVMTKDGKRSAGGVEVYLLPDGNNILTARTDDSGSFNLPGVPAGTYSIIIRDPSDGMSGKVSLRMPQNEIEIKKLGAKISYIIGQGR
jgi:hypothetical protein